MRESLRIREPLDVRRREGAVRRRLRVAPDGPKIASATATRLVLTSDVAAEFRAVLVAADGAERVVDVVVEFPDGARALLLAARWRVGAGILHAVRDAGLGCLRRVGAERLLAVAFGDRATVRASIDDIRRVLPVPTASD